MILKRIKIETSIENFTNCYIVADEKENEAILIDPAGECNKIMEMLDILRNKTKIYIFNSLSCRPYSEH